MYIKTKGGAVMAQRWSLKEDFIIANFCEESDYRYMSEERLDELMERLD